MNCQTLREKINDVIYFKIEVVYDLPCQPPSRLNANLIYIRSGENTTQKERRRQREREREREPLEVRSNQRPLASPTRRSRRTRQRRQARGREDGRRSPETPRIELSLRPHRVAYFSASCNTITPSRAASPTHTSRVAPAPPRPAPPHRPRTRARGRRFPLPSFYFCFAKLVNQTSRALGFSLPVGFSPRHTLRLRECVRACASRRGTRRADHHHAAGET